MDSSSLPPSETVEASQIVTASAADKPAAEHDQTVSAEEAPQELACAKCKGKGKQEEMIERGSFRPGLRYICKPCHAVVAQCQRKGLQLGSLLNTEMALVNFFSEASLERKNAEEGRLNFQRIRTLLKKSMVEEVRHTYKDAQNGEYLPLSVYELRGFDTAAIEASCPCELHPVLVATCKLDIHSESTETLWLQAEKKIAEMEHNAQQRKAAAAATSTAALAAGEPSGVPELDMEYAMEAVHRGSKRKGPMTEEEKEEQKRHRAAARKFEADRKAATAAAAKLLPALKTCKEKLDGKVDKIGDQAYGHVVLPEVREQVESAQAALDKTIEAASKLLDMAAKGKSSDGLVLSWTKEKEVQDIIKQGNSALRALHEVTRPPNAAADGTKKAKGRGRGPKA
jgi:hypothetical protein